MAGRAALRVAIDAAFAGLALIALAAAAQATWSKGAPPVPAGVCAGDGALRHDALVADGRLAVAAVFGQIGDGPGGRDFGAVSRRLLEAALRARGFVAAGGDHYRRADGEVTIDVTLTGPAGLPRAFPALTAHALADALATADVVYYNGHVFEGVMPLAAPAAGYRIAVLDTCWSTQRYSPRLIGPSIDVIGNRERAITGSVASFVALLDGLDARAPRWSSIITSMNTLADARAAARAGRTHLDRPERYRLDTACE